VVERSPEKAGVGGSTPSRGTIFSITYNQQEPNPVTSCHRTNSSDAEVCLSLSLANPAQIPRAGQNQTLSELITHQQKAGKA
jgi:hypothetical protein